MSFILIVDVRAFFICLRHSLNDLTAVHRDSEKMIRRITRALMLGGREGAELETRSKVE